MRESRAGKLIWDDIEKATPGTFSTLEHAGQLRLQSLLDINSKDAIDHSGYELGTDRSLSDYERYSGIRFRDKTVQLYTFEAHLPPNSVIDNENAYVIARNQWF